MLRYEVHPIQITVLVVLIQVHTTFPAPPLFFKVTGGLLGKCVASLCSKDVLQNKQEGIVSTFEYY
jgi:hypothetical protein